jgi:predicted negative regulator of RcsB-dependent stress response
MSDNTTTNNPAPNSKTNTPVQGTHWKNLSANSTQRIATPVTASGDIDWGKWIEANKNGLTIGLIVLLVAIFGGGYWFTVQSKSKENYNSKIYTFEKSALDEYSKSGNADNLVSSFNLLYQSTGNYVGVIPVVLKVSDALIAHEKLEDALKVLTTGKNISGNEYAQFFINTRLAVVFEDLGKNQEAIDVLNKLSQSDLKVFEGKYYLDLGRVYLKMGNKEKAKASFQYVLDKAKEDIEFVKIAKLELANI